MGVDQDSNQACFSSRSMPRWVSGGARLKMAAPGANCAANWATYLSRWAWRRFSRTARIASWSPEAEPFGPILRDIDAFIVAVDMELSFSCCCCVISVAWHGVLARGVTRSRCRLRQWE